MGSPRTILLCLFGAVLCLTGAQTSTPHSVGFCYLGVCDCQSIEGPLTSVCVSVILGSVLSLSGWYRASVTLVKKGCWTGLAGQMEANQDSLPPDFSLVRGCTTDRCNVDIMNHDSIPNLSPAPDPPLLSGTECYACVGILPEDCAPNKSRRVQCHQKESVCFQGNGRMTIGNFSVPVYIRTCHRPSCTIVGTTSPWSDIDLHGSCCQGNLCNRDSVFELFTAAAAPPQASHSVVLLLTLPLLVGALGGPLGLSS
uniref:Ly6/PLAUR domain-containing protein 5 n=1 Tax=Loxodonta africana TaxID=9785 RepID=G3TVJ8_LOXAF